MTNLRPCGYCLFCSNKLVNNGYAGLYCDHFCADAAEDVLDDIQESPDAAND